MKVQKSPLVAALGRLSHISRSTESNVTRHLCLEAVGGILTISATNLDQWASENLVCDGDLARVLVPASSFIPTVTFGNEEQLFQLTGNGRLRCDVGAEINLPVLNEDWPTPKLDDMKLVAVNCSDLADCIKRVKWSISQDKGRPELHAVHAVTSAKNISCETFEGTLGSFCNHASICGEADITIHSAFVDSICSAMNMDGAQLSCSPSLLNVWHENGTYSCKVPESWRMDTKKITSAERVMLGSFSRDEWLASFRYIQSTRGPKDDQTMRTSIALSDKSCIIKSHPTDSGSSNFSRKIDGRFEFKTLFVNAVSFARCLAAFPEGSTIDLKHTTAFDGICLECGDLAVMTTQLRPDVIKEVTGGKPEVTP